MKWLKLILMGLIIFSYSCKNIREKILPTFTFTIPEINLRVPPIPIVTGREIPVGALRTPINMDSTVKAYTAGTFGAEAVTTVKVKKVLVKALNADRKNNLSNFESARIVIYHKNASTEIASFNFPIGFTDSIVAIPAVEKDISEYLKGSELNYNLFWKNRKKTTKSLKLSVRITIGVQ